jgi:hypothetical protein
MFLRDHPLMTHQGIRNWPPIWICTTGKQAHPARGEFGILKQVKAHDYSLSKCFLYMEDNHAIFISHLSFDYSFFCQKVVQLLKKNCGLPIRAIGGLEVNSTGDPLSLPPSHGFGMTGGLYTRSASGCDN